MLFYENNIFKKVYPYKYIGIDIYHKLNWNYSVWKRKNGGWKDSYGIEMIVINWTFADGKVKKSSLRNFSLLLSHTVVKLGDVIP